MEIIRGRRGGREKGRGGRGGEERGRDRREGRGRLNPSDPVIIV